MASDVPAAREVLDDGVDGLLYPVGDARALADRVLEVVRDPARRAAIEAAARKKACLHDMRGVVERHESVLRDAARR